MLQYVSGDIWLGVQEAWNPWSATNTLEEANCPTAGPDDQWHILAGAGHSCESILLTSGESCETTLAVAVPTLFGAGAQMAGYGKQTVGTACPTSCLDPNDPKWECDPSQARSFARRATPVVQRYSRTPAIRMPYGGNCGFPSSNDFCD